MDFPRDVPRSPVLSSIYNTKLATSSLVSKLSQMGERKGIGFFLSSPGIAGPVDA